MVNVANIYHTWIPWVLLVGEFYFGRFLEVLFVNFKHVLPMKSHGTPNDIHHSKCSFLEVPAVRELLEKWREDPVRQELGGSI